MRNILKYTLLIILLTLYGHAVTRGDVKVIEASENIRYLSQKLAKDYLFFYQHPERREIKLELEQSLFRLTDDIRIIAATTKDMDTKYILEFLAYSKEFIANIVKEHPDEEKAALMLDYSETLLEGADSIALSHQYDFSDEEKMLMATKKMQYLLERIAKYYMALHIGFATTTNEESMKEAIEGFNTNINLINGYKYPANEVRLQVKVNHSWQMNKIYFMHEKDLFIPKLILDSVDYLEDVVSTLSLYHSKNQ